MPTAKRDKARPSTGSATPAGNPEPDSLGAFLRAAASPPPEEGLPEEEAAADAIARRWLELLATAADDQADDRAPTTPRSDRKQPRPRKPR